MTDLTFGLAFWLVSIVAYEAWRGVAVWASNKGEYSKLLSGFLTVLFVVGILGGYTVGLLDMYIDNKTYDKQIIEMRKVREIASAHKRPPQCAEEYYGFDCDMFAGEDGSFDLWEWQQHEYEKLGI